MAKPKTATRRRGDAEETRRRVLDAVVETVVDIGYYKASSNEIARRAGVTWGAIQHLFGSREQLMMEVVNDIRRRTEERFASESIEGATLEDRLWSVLGVLSTHYESQNYFVGVQIMLDLSANPRMSANRRRAIRRNNGKEFDKLAQPLFVQAFGDVAAERDLVVYAFTTLRAYLGSRAISRLLTELPDDAKERDLLVRGVAAAVRQEAALRGYQID